MLLCTQPTGFAAMFASSRVVADRTAMWRLGCLKTIASVGNQFTPYAQRPRESLL